MSVFRIQKTKNYTVMSNYHLRDCNLSLKAKGLMSMMLSLPDSWNFSVGGLCSICKENQTAIKSALKELKAHGYLTVTRMTPDRTDSGRIEWVYDLFEVPQESAGTGNNDNSDQGDDQEDGQDDDEDDERQEPQQEQKQQYDSQPIENRRELNTNIINKDNQNKDILNTNECMFEDKRTVLNSQARDYFVKNNLQGDPDKFVLYYLFLSDDVFEKKFRYLAHKWSNNEFVDLPIRLYDDDYREAVMSVIPNDLQYDIDKELEESDCGQIRYKTYLRLVEFLDLNDLGFYSL